jgi:DNA helicase-2/ATP-dependent DNA helicase PcrA
MPIILNAKTTTSAKGTAKSAYNVKFFSKDFTGTGASIGLINATMNPANLPPLTPVDAARFSTRIRTDFNKVAKTVTYPIDPLGGFGRKYMKLKQLKRYSCKLSDNVNGSVLHVQFTPVTIAIEELLVKPDPNLTIAPPPAKTLKVSYRIEFIEEIQVNGSPVYRVIEEEFTQNPAATMRDKLLGGGIVVDGRSFLISAANKVNYDNYLSGYDLYGELNEISKTWQTTITDEIISVYDEAPQSFPMATICRYLSTYKLSMSQYQRFYQEIKKRFPPDTIKIFTQVNTYLLLQDTMNNLAQAQLTALQPPSSIPNYTVPDLSWCSREQLAAVTSLSPLNLVQAGAGTGKSTTIRGRIEYLLSLGVSASDILVLSFTNAATENMKKIAPGIESMTIAKMIDEIYTLEHPTHKLASAAARKGEGSTFTNSLSMHTDANPVAEELMFAAKRAEVDNDYATLLRLVEEKYDDVIALLDEIEQTTFQLEIILTYLEHAKLNIPFNIKHLIIDEVQDNAVFEFIFFLNLTCKLKNHLYLVGDCSQTLYEFRASDPKALSVIENSGIFQTYPLNINYRSNQAILNFANTLLNDIEANQNAHIQLQSFTLAQITQQDFAEIVTVDYERLSKIGEAKESIGRRFHSGVKPWIADRLKRNDPQTGKPEQILVLTFTRLESEMLQELVKQHFPNTDTVSILIRNKTIAF